ncbi:C2H2 finger domain-containing protein [Metarhizium album ARSEF 1941]|uniref:C2H2 finger domain-containing protein n=1 Tax=Metarhizium album (strain ARSEF 1941) TaxID=1081103 RepID=A0A0B2WZE1_METAS|nr:C2H2 finger domain-containing protein [Metarhizium album ARSEF 1941]KHN99408.1 C2H2 finger domain-containing protein [Metarhizium album ARSEF 1941]
MAFSPAACTIHSDSSTIRAAKTSYRESRPTTSSPETSQLLHDLSFKVEHGGRLDPSLASSVSFEELHQFNTPFPSAARVDCEPAAEVTTGYTTRYRSPACAYLSPEYSSAYSPSMASDGMHEHSHESSKIWTMTPTRDAERNMPHRTSTPVSLGGAVNYSQVFVPAYDAAPSKSTPTNWPPHASGIHPSGDVDFNLAADQATSGMANMAPKQHQTLTLNYLNLAPLPEDGPPSYTYGSGPAHGFTDCTTSVAVLSYERPLFEDPIQLSPEPHTGTAAGPSGPRAARPVRDIEEPVPPVLPRHTDGRTTTCKSCRRTMTGPIEEEAHDRECDRLRCLFRFAGCKARFKGKNEWKRHIRTQHLLPMAFVCAECDMKEFNRKDLFKQHHIRMHSTDEEADAFKRKRPSKALEKRLQEKFQQASRGVETPPLRAHRCLLQGCDTKFPEADSWERCLEHVAKHLEAMMKGREEERHYIFTNEQMDTFQKMGAIVYDNGQWILGAQSSGERARRNKKKIARRQADGGPGGPAPKARRSRRS